MLDSDALGKLGENYFGVLCSGANLTYNSSLNWDRAGWDFIIDFELDESGAVSLDHRKSPISCRVQQKTIYASTTSVTLSLKMAERLAKDPMPTFISVFKVDENNQVVESYLIHMSGDRLEVTLKRLREENATGSSEELKDKTISFTPRDGERMEFAGASLRADLNKHIGKDIHAYTERKKKELGTVGFEEMAYSGKFLIDVVDQEAFDDMFLGLSKEIEVRDMEISETRFGITLPESFSATAKISITPNPFDDFTATFEGDSSDEEPALFEGEAYRTPIGSDKKIFLQGHFLGILIELLESGSKISFSHTLDKLGSIYEWLNYWKAMNVCQSKKGYITLKLKNFPTPVILKLETATVEVSFKNIGAFVFLFETLEKIERRGGIRPGAMLSIDAVSKVHKEIKFVRSMMNGEDIDLKFKLNATPEQASAIKNEMIFAYSLEIDDEVIACYACANLDITTIDEGIALKVTNMTLKKFGVVTSQEEFQSFVDNAKQRESIDVVISGGRFNVLH